MGKFIATQETRLNDISNRRTQIVHINNKISNIQSRIDDWNAKVFSLGRQIDEANKNIKNKKDTITSIELDIEKIQNEIDINGGKKNLVVPKITDHAMLRLVERYYKCDLDSIKNDILDDDTIRQINWMGDGKGRITKDNYILCINGGSIVTILENKKAK